MKLIRILPLIAPLILTACAYSTSSDNISSPGNSITVSDNATVGESNVNDSSNAGDDNSTAEPKLIGVCGEVINPENFDERPDYALNEYLYYRTDYGCAALFDGEIYNSHDDPDKFNFDEWQCTEQCKPASGGFFAVNVGDSVGGLTCIDACAEYFLNENNSVNASFGLMNSTVCFEGEVEVTGYVDRFEGYEGYVDEGELYFYPDGESWNGLPIPYDDSGYHTFYLNDESLMYTPVRLSLGTVYDYSGLGLEYDIPQGTTTHLKCVLKDIQLKYVNSSFGGYTISTAVIVSAEVIG